MSAPTTTCMAANDWKPFIKGSLRGFFDLTLASGLVIRGCALMEKNDSKWINLPQQKVVKAGGEVSYVTILEFTDRSTADRFRDAALRALEELVVEA